jgi:hypothetical protein
LTSGGNLISSVDLQVTLTDLVEATLTRLDELEIRDTQLHKEWRSIQSLDGEELAFCDAAARLGLDPFDVDTDISESLEVAGAQVPANLLPDFLNAVDPSRIVDGIAWIEKASRELTLLTRPPEPDVSLMRVAVTQARTPASSTSPWSIGYQQARLARESLGLGDSDPLPIHDLVASTSRLGPSGEVDGVGVGSDGVRLVLTRRSTQVDVRFASARALWHALTDELGAPFLLTHARTYRQKIERAFAAEILAPVAGVAAHLNKGGLTWDAHAVDEIARSYGVGPLLVQHQIENNLLAGPS